MTDVLFAKSLTEFTQNVGEIGRDGLVAVHMPIEKVDFRAPRSDLAFAAAAVGSLYGPELPAGTRIRRTPRKWSHVGETGVHFDCFDGAFPEVSLWVHEY